MEDNKQLKARIQDQFGFHAKEYLESKVHSSGKSLAKIVDIIQPKPHWHVLDVATGAGHTGLAFARIVSHVTAIDLTRPMLETAQEQAAINHQLNFDVCQAEAEELPFKESSFDLVTCRIAAHHFLSVTKFMTAAARSLKAGGVLVVVDNVVPSTFSEGKKFRHIEQAGRYINAFERLRDPSHRRCLGLDEWVEHFYSAGIRLSHSETMMIELAFGPWVARTHISSVDIIRLKAMILHAPRAVKDFLDPQLVGGELVFHLTKGIMVGTKDD